MRKNPGVQLALLVEQGMKCLVSVGAWPGCFPQWIFPFAKGAMGSLTVWEEGISSVQF